MPGEGAVVPKSRPGGAGLEEGLPIALELLRRPGRLHARAGAKDRGDRPSAPGGEEALGQAGDEEGEDVRRAGELARVPYYLPRDRGRVGRVQDGQPLDDFRAAVRGHPGDRAAPVVADNGRPVTAKRANKRSEILDKGREVIRPSLVRLRKAAKIRRDSSIPGTGECRQLVAPGARVLGESVQEEDEGPGRGSRGEGVEAEPVCFDEEVVHGSACAPRVRSAPPTRARTWMVFGCRSAEVKRACTALLESSRKPGS